MSKLKLGRSVPVEIQEVLNEYVDIMPRRPCPRGIDHEIELVPGAKPPAQNAYRMAPSELASLRKELVEFLIAG